MSIAENIETVVSTFQKGRSLSEQELGLGELISKLNQFEPRYRSVAFEGASMGVALQNSIETWKTYANQTEKHATQVHIGLGWAIAQPPKSPEGGTSSPLNPPKGDLASHPQLDLASTLSLVEAEMKVKVLDGYGYWHGLFQRRATIRTQQIPENIVPEFQTGFDHGVGRAIWYATKGDVAKVMNIINHFSEDRRPNLWQGIGVASTYVGGCSDELIAELKTTAGTFKKNLEQGIEAAEGSLRKAES